MIAAQRRMATLDFLLVTMAATTVLLSFWPARQSRQIVELRGTSGRVQRYSLEREDPRLEQLTRAAAERSRPRPTASLATLKWLAETADFYAHRSEPKESEADYVLPVAYRRDPSASPPASETEVWIAQQNYWIKVRDESERKVVQAETQLKLQQSLAVPPPVVIGDVIVGGHSANVLVVSTIMGLGIAGIFGLWTYASPPIRLLGDNALSREVSAPRHRQPASREIQIVIPSRWVRVHQPMSVTIRRGAQAVVIIAGLLCAVA